MFSVYTSAFNINKMGFSWKEALDNWVQFLNGTGQIVIAVNTSEDDTYESLLQYAWELKQKYQSNVDWSIFKVDIPYSDHLFDGKIKDEALKRCTERYCILLDLDEVAPLYSRDAWLSAAALLENDTRYEALLIPSIDLFHDEFNYKGLSSKWYLHRNLPYLGRGAVGFARREDKTIDITKSDSTELINRDTLELAKAAPMIDQRFNQDVQLGYLREGGIPFVVHNGWLNKEQRLKQSAFWSPVWNRREGREVEKPKTMEDLDKITYKPHRLRDWRLS